MQLLGFIFTFSLVSLCTPSDDVQFPVTKNNQLALEDPRPYVYGYGVHFPSTGDTKEHREATSVDGLTKGEFRWLQPNGLFRVVRYFVDGLDGFQANVTEEKGHPITNYLNNNIGNIPPSNIPPSNIPPSNIPPSNIPPSNIPPSNIPPSNIPPSNLFTRRWSADILPGNRQGKLAKATYSHEPHNSTNQVIEKPLNKKIFEKEYANFLEPNLAEDIQLEVYGKPIKETSVDLKQLSKGFDTLIPNVSANDKFDTYNNKAKYIQPTQVENLTQKKQHTYNNKAFGKKLSAAKQQNQPSFQNEQYTYNNYKSYGTKVPGVDLNVRLVHPIQNHTSNYTAYDAQLLGIYSREQPLILNSNVRSNVLLQGEVDILNKITNINNVGHIKSQSSRLEESSTPDKITYHNVNIEVVPVNSGQPLIPNPINLHPIEIAHTSPPSDFQIIGTQNKVDTYSNYNPSGNPGFQVIQDKIDADIDQVADEASSTNFQKRIIPLISSKVNLYSNADNSPTLVEEYGEVRKYDPFDSDISGQVTVESVNKKSDSNVNYHVAIPGVPTGIFREDTSKFQVNRANSAGQFSDTPNFPYEYSNLKGKQNIGNIPLHLKTETERPKYIDYFQLHQADCSQSSFIPMKGVPYKYVIKSEEKFHKPINIQLQKIVPLEIMHNYQLKYDTNNEPNIGLPHNAPSIDYNIKLKIPGYYKPKAISGQKGQSHEPIDSSPITFFYVKEKPEIQNGKDKVYATSHHKEYSADVIPIKHILNSNNDDPTKKLMEDHINAYLKAQFTKINEDDTPTSFILPNTDKHIHVNNPRESAIPISTYYSHSSIPLSPHDSHSSIPLSTYNPKSSIPISPYNTQSSIPISSHDSHSSISLSRHDSHSSMTLYPFDSHSSIPLSTYNPKSSIPLSPYDSQSLIPISPDDSHSSINLSPFDSHSSIPISPDDSHSSINLSPFDSHSSMPLSTYNPKSSIPLSPYGAQSLIPISPHDSHSSINLSPFDSHSSMPLSIYNPKSSIPLSPYDAQSLIPISPHDSHSSINLSPFDSHSSIPLSTYNPKSSIPLSPYDAQSLIPISPHDSHSSINLSPFYSHSSIPLSTYNPKSSIPISPYNTQLSIPISLHDSHSSIPLSTYNPKSSIPLSPYNAQSLIPISPYDSHSSIPLSSYNTHSSIEHKQLGNNDINHLQQHDNNKNVLPDTFPEHSLLFKPTDQTFENHGNHGNHGKVVYNQDITNPSVIKDVESSYTGYTSTVDNTENSNPVIQSLRHGENIISSNYGTKYENERITPYWELNEHISISNVPKSDISIPNLHRETNIIPPTQIEGPSHDQTNKAKQIRIIESPRSKAHTVPDDVNIPNSYHGSNGIHDFAIPVDDPESPYPRIYQDNNGKTVRIIETSRTFNLPEGYIDSSREIQLVNNGLPSPYFYNQPFHHMYAVPYDQISELYFESLRLPIVIKRQRIFDSVLEFLDNPQSI